jgi:shikimate dehydrogenase
VEHSLSPRLFGLLFDELGMKAGYRALKTRPEELGQRVQSVRVGELGGLSVTLPHKETIIALLDELSPAAAAMGAVNCVASSGLRVLGHNTDGRGFELALDRAGVRLAGARVLILGAGGAARAAAFRAAQAGARSIVIANRTPARADALAADLVARGLAQAAAGHRAESRAAGGVSSFGPGGQLTLHSPATSGRSSAPACVVYVLPLSASALAGERADIVVNATSVGLDSSADPLPESFQLDGTHALLDMVYRPLQTALLSRARAVGTMAIDGVWMLVYQALEQLRIWTSRSVPAELAARLHSKLCEEAG